MPMGQAFFLDMNTWELIPVQEHFEAVKADPKRYRIDKKAITKDRNETLTKVLKRGFIRIREDVKSATWSMEGYGSWDDMFSAALTFAKLHNLPESAYFRLGNLRDPRNSPRDMSLRAIMAEAGFSEAKDLDKAIAFLNERRARDYRRRLDEAINMVNERRTSDAVSHVLESPT